jgi:CDP-diacylglycerol--glycerol-3-phosphate 3-phosphatidyltransferase
MTFTDRMRQISGGTLSRVGSGLHRAGIQADWITIAGLGLVALAAYFISQGQMTSGLILLLLALPLDALDGAVARAANKQDAFGGVLDSTLDRYADGFIFGALGYHFVSQGQPEYLLLALAALIGSFGVSYVRARAGEAGLSVKGGLFSRLERVLVLLVMLAIPALLLPGLWLLALGTNITAIHRLWLVRRITSEG